MHNCDTCPACTQHIPYMWHVSCVCCRGENDEMDMDDGGDSEENDPELRRLKGKSNPRPRIKRTSSDTQQQLTSSPAFRPGGRSINGSGNPRPRQGSSGRKGLPAMPGLAMPGQGLTPTSLLPGTGAGAAAAALAAARVRPGHAGRSANRAAGARSVSRPRSTNGGMPGAVRPRGGRMGLVKGSKLSEAAEALMGMGAMGHDSDGGMEVRGPLGRGRGGAL